MLTDKWLIRDRKVSHVLLLLVLLWWWWCGGCCGVVWWWWCVSGVGLYNDFHIPQTSKQPEFVFKNRNWQALGLLFSLIFDVSRQSSIYYLSRKSCNILSRLPVTSTWGPSITTVISVILSVANLIKPASMIVIYKSRVVNISNLLVSTTLESQFTLAEYF